MRRATAWAGPLVGLVLLLFFYRSALFGGGQFAFRDAAHYYYPLYHKVQAEWDAGRWPLWDPSENAGMPLLGNPTAAVLYPGKLIYAALPYPWAARIYAVAHTALAFAGMLGLLRSWGASRPAAAIAATSYAFGAPVLFQHCNIIFLVGAAWLPPGFWAVDRWLRLGRPLALPALAAVLAMLVLGGDPESAYVLGLCAGGYALGLSRRRPWAGIGARGWIVAAGLVSLYAAAAIGLAAILPGFRPERAADPWAMFRYWFNTGQLPRFHKAAFPGPVSGFPWVTALPTVAAGVGLAIGLVLLNRRRRRGAGGYPVVARVAGLAGAALLAGAIAAAQLGPILEYARMSGRATPEGAHDIYPFSIEPYRLAELAWPGFFGRSYGSSISWGGVLLPGLNHRPWTPSIYVGGLALVLGLSAFGFRGGMPWRGWLAGVAACALIGGLGEYASPLLYARYVPALVPWIGPHDSPDTNAVRLDGWLRDGDGSPYCLVAGLLPGFGSFRFPSKLLTFASLALAGLAGLGWDAAVAGSGRSRRAMRLAAIGAAASLLLAIAAYLARGPIAGRLASFDLISMFGPLDAPRAASELALALFQGAVVLGSSAGLIGFARRRPGAAGWLAAGLLGVDLAWVHASIVSTVPQAVFDAEPRVVRLIREAEARDPSPGPYRVHRQPEWGPAIWFRERSDDRIGDFARWETGSLTPKYGLLHGVEYAMTVGMAELYDYEWFFAPFPRRLTAEAAPSLGVAPGTSIVIHPRRGFDLWTARYFILPGRPDWDDSMRGIASFLPQTEPIYPPPDTFREPGSKGRTEAFVLNDDVRITRNLDAFPRAWVVHEARFPKPIVGLTRAARDPIMREILFSNDPFWSDPDRTPYDPHRTVWVETDEPARLAPYLTGSAPSAGEVVRHLVNEPQRVELEATLSRAGIVVLADAYYPGWHLTIDGEPAQILRANRMMRGAAVRAGTHRLVYTYDPQSFRVGAKISLIGIATTLAIAAVAVAAGRSRRRPGIATPGG